MAYVRAIYFFYRTIKHGDSEQKGADLYNYDMGHLLMSFSSTPTVEMLFRGCTVHFTCTSRHSDVPWDCDSLALW